MKTAEKTNRFSYKELLAKAMGEPIIPVAEKTANTDELFKKAKEAMREPAPGRGISERDAKPEPVKTAQELMDDLSSANVEESNPTPAPMSDEEKAARRKEISAKALAAKRAKKAAAEATPTPAPVVPNPVEYIITKGKNKENRAILNDLLLKNTGRTLIQTEESTGKFGPDAVVKLIEDIKASLAAKPDEKKPKPAPKSKTESKTANKTPLSKMTLAELDEVKGTINPVQWVKYYKMACKREGVEASKPETRVRVNKPIAAAPIPVVKNEDAPAPVRTRTAPVTKKEEATMDPRQEEINRLACNLYIAFKAYSDFIENNK